MVGNKKGTMIPGQEIVSVAAILFAFIIVFFFTMMLGGGVTEETQQSQAEMEESIQTSNLLLNMLEAKDVDGNGYAELIELSMEDSTIYSYTERLLFDWLGQNIEQYDYHFQVKYEGSSYFNRATSEGVGSAGVHEVNIFLPTENGKLVEVVLETW